MSSKFVTIREFARSIGVSHTAIQKAIASGRLSRPGKNGLNLKKATAEWKQSGSGVTMAGVSASGPARGKPRTPSAPEIDDPDEDGDGPEKETPEDPTSKSYLQGRAMERVYKAKIARMEHDRMAGLLISSAAIKSRVFSVGREIRDQILNVPNRISAELAAQTDTHLVHLRLTEELNQTLATIADRLTAAINEAATVDEP